MSVTSDYTKARLEAEKRGEKLSFTQFQGGATGTTPSGLNTLSPASPTPTSTTPTFMQRDRTLEDATKSKLGLSNIQLTQLAENPEFKKRLFEMTYGDKASNIKEYQDLTQPREELQGQMSALQQNAPNAMLALEDALRTKENVGKQQLGESELFKQAGLDGFFSLNASLANQSKIMEDRYGSFINALSRAGQYQTNTYQGLATQYKTLTDEYLQKSEELNKVLQSAEDFNQQMSFAEQQFNYEKQLIDYKISAERNSYDIDTMNSNEESWANGTYRSDPTSDTSTMQISNQDFENAANCILWLRDTGAEMPYGLYTIDDKKAAITSAGSTDMSKVQVGDIILTSEGDVGHGARVASIDGDILYLEEANYEPGKVSTGRKLNKNAAVMLGFIPQGDLTANTGFDKFDKALNRMGEIALTRDMSNANFLDYVVSPDSAKLEGGNPSIKEQVISKNKPTGVLNSVPQQAMGLMLEWTNSSVYRKEEIEAIFSGTKYWDTFQAIKTGDFSGILDEESIKYTNTLKNLLPDNKDKVNKIYSTASNIENGKIDLAKSSVNSAMMDNMGAEVSKSYKGGLSLLYNFETIENAFNELESQGIVVGNLEEMAEILGTMHDPKLAAAKNYVNLLIQGYTKDQSGAQFSVQEFERYKDLFPDITNIKDLNLVKIQQLRESIQSRINSDIGTYTNFNLSGMADIIPESKWSDYGINTWRGLSDNFKTYAKKVGVNVEEDLKKSSENEVWFYNMNKLAVQQDYPLAEALNAGVPAYEIEDLLIKNYGKSN